MKKILPFLLLLAACASAEYAESEYSEKLAPWVGKSLNELYAAWGPPDNIQTLGDGAFLVSYYSSESTPADGVFQPYASEMNYSAMAVPDYGLPPPPPFFYCETLFTVRRGTVTNYSFNGDDCY